MSVCVGMDVGGSGTRAALAEPDGTLLAVSCAGRDALDEALAPLRAQVGSRGCLVHLGLAGLSRRGRRARALARVADLLPGAAVEVTHDAAIALWGALPDGQGVVVLAGTGSMALARAADGREARAGGHGFLFGDEGGAFWLVREAVRAALAAAEGRGPSTQLSEVLRATARSPGGLPPTRRTVARLAQLAPLVSLAARQGDAAAQQIVLRAARELSDLATSAAHQVWGASPPPGLPVATCGGVWQAGGVLLHPFAAELATRLPEARRVEPRLAPVGGALLLACRRVAGLQGVSVERLADGLARHAQRGLLA